MSLPQDKNDYIECGNIGIDDDDENNNSNHAAHTESNNSSSFIATDDYSTSNSDKNEGNKSIDVPVVFASEDYNSKNNDDGIMLVSTSTVAKKMKKKKLSSNAKTNTKKVNPSSVKPKDKEEEIEKEEEEGGVGCNNKEVVVLVLPPVESNTNNSSSSTIIGKSNNNILVSKLNNSEEIVHISDSLSEEGRDDNGGSNKNVAEQPVLPNNEDDFSSTFSSKPYPADTYSLLSLHGPVGNPSYFSYGLMVYLFQMTFLVLMVLSVTHPHWSSNGDGDNPDGGRGSVLARLAYFVPSHVSPLVRATQITATLSYIIFADSTVLDVVTAVELFPRFNQATSDDKLGCMVFASILRLSQGIFAITVTLLLIVTSSTTIEIILNFTAINFISTLDDVGFEIIKRGKYGPKFEEEAKRIEKLHVRYFCTIIPVGVILFSMICFMIFLQESNNHWVTKIFRVQFQDEEQGLQVYNGCYQKNEDAINRYEGFRRKLYESFGYNSESAKFGYCIDDRRWILFNGDNTNPCEAGGNDNELARSSKTDTFDVSTMFEEQWYTSSNTPLNLYFVEENGDIELKNNTCSSFIGDSNCDSVFNDFDSQYDGGDCCAATCSGSNCGVGSLKNAFGATNKIAFGDGFPNCVDPDMVPITIRLDNIIRSSGRVEQEPVKSLLFIDCDGSNVLNIYVDKSMENQTETIMVNDGADCTMTIRNDSSYYSPIWYADYTILHGGKKSIESNSIVVTQSSSAKESTYGFKRIPVCYFDKLYDYIDSLTVYTGINFDPTAKAIDWLINDESENSMFNDELTGSIPSEIGLMTSLVNLDLRGNAFTGSIPSEIGLMTSLSNLYLNNNALYVIFDSVNNKLTGSIPSEIGLMTSLVNLYLYDNKLTGSIPSEIGLMTSLTFLDLRGNAFTGSIPSEIGLMTSLSNLYLSKKSIESNSIVVTQSSSAKESTYGFKRIPVCYFDKLYDYIDSLTVYTGINFDPTAKAIDWLINDESENSMCEDPFFLERYALAVIYFATYSGCKYTMISTMRHCVWPNIICDEGTVISLEMINDELTGSIPSEIGLMTSLVNLDLRGNAFTGSIPSEIGLMTSIGYLQYQRNVRVVLWKSSLQVKIPGINDFDSFVTIWQEGINNKYYTVPQEEETPYVTVDVSARDSTVLDQYDKVLALKARAGTELTYDEMIAKIVNTDRKRDEEWGEGMIAEAGKTGKEKEIAENKPEKYIARRSSLFEIDNIHRMSGLGLATKDAAGDDEDSQSRRRSRQSFIETGKFE
ncbi:L domain-like protein [Fragilariopsis cylindrus CCMP1102]|uniref:L domain-like protein n=1 Tax=Fragilariopsis cylindrus CCMP1102 TaxID=635003 RepID=A0A1E7EJF6_9STRA|nr:L domain-like protein [Fragilariopsis cylindrus CCMP1102]|eukprot:OEU06031.1 L domain-like protein [Fragilariopsis cylindrus CCMP1102]